MKRTLALKKDTLSELATDDLRVVVGGSAGTCFTCLDCVVDRVVDAVTKAIDWPVLPPLPSLDTPCH